MQEKKPGLGMNEPGIENTKLSNGEVGVDATMILLKPTMRACLLLT